MSFSEGRLDLDGSPATTGQLNTSGYVTGTIGTATDSDWYACFLVAGVTYTWTLADGTVDAVLTLRDGAGGALVSLAGNGAGRSATLSYTTSTTGLYFADVQSAPGGSARVGDYRLALDSSAADDYDASTDTTSTLLPGQQRAAAIQTAGDADWHRLTVQAGHSYMLSVTGALNGAALRVLDGQGQDLDLTGSGSVTFTAAADATRYVEVAAASLATRATYAVTLSEVPTLHVDDVQIVEGNGTSVPLTFTLKLSAVSSQDVTVQVATIDLTAIAGIDYTPLQRTVTIPAGSLSAPVTVQVNANLDFQPNRVFTLQLSDAVNAAVGLGPAAVGVVLDDDRPTGMTLPGDPLMGYQWYLYDVRAPYAWQIATGKGVKVGVFDEGVDAAQPDLRNNAGLALGVDAASLTRGGAPRTADDNHGTWVAGVLAAASDGLGLVGAAYDASLVPIYSSLQLGGTVLQEMTRAFQYAQSLDVLNNSWGFGNQLLGGTDWAFYDNAQDPAFAPVFAALKSAADNGRAGLGTVVVQSAGNGYDYGDDTNLHNFQNSRYVITVGATDYFGRASVFSTTGASILVSAPGGDGGQSYASILTTDRVGSAGDNAGDTAYVDGTSFAAPIVSGVVALMLQANPQLGYRDVQQILAYTAQQIDVGVGDWNTNGAGNWNGGGLHYNSATHATGFGQVDALAAVRLASSWTATPMTSANAAELSATRTVNTVIPDNSDTGLASSLTMAAGLVVERAEVTVHIQHPYVGDLSIVLVSPSQTYSVLMYRPAQGELSAFGSAQHDVNFTFDTVLDWGESSAGEWSLRVFDSFSGDVGTLQSWQLKLIGQAESADDVYVYTNEYPELLATDPTRGVLRDSDGGSNTLNAAALGLDNVIDLSGRAPSMLNGAPLSLAAGTLITTGVGGDGNDQLTASDRGSVLRGMRGNDLLHGGTGADTLDGGDGIDLASYTEAMSDYEVTRITEGWRVTGGNSGGDALVGIERLQFADQSLALDLDGHAGTVARILGAVFGPSAVQNQPYAGIGLHYSDDGMSRADLMQLALDARLGPAASHAAVVDLLYTNVVGVHPSASELAGYVALLDNGSYTPATLGIFAADTDINAGNIQLVGLVQTGLGYVSFGR